MDPDQDQTFCWSWSDSKLFMNVISRWQKFAASKERVKVVLVSWPWPTLLLLKKTTYYTGLDFKIFFNLFLLLINRTNIYKTQKLPLRSRMNFDNLICKPVIFTQYGIFQTVLLYLLKDNPFYEHQQETKVPILAIFGTFSQKSSEINPKR